MDPTTSFNSKNPEMLRPQIAELNISKNEILLVTLPDQPGTSRIPTAVDQEYEDCFLQAHTKGKFTEDDIELNDIVDANDGDVPKKYKRTLGRKRKIRGAAEVLVCRDDFDYSAANASESIPTANNLEVLHLAKFCPYIGQSVVTLMNGNFKEGDANWLFFYTIANHIGSRSSDVARDGTPKITTKL
ncbi:hypothetical protein EDB83DRAFT_2348119 [Lactarius deliciosus]|nr:hypothetical protein EDB83DRAFT_2348119 [Lactarius deliciosus]